MKLLVVNAGSSSLKCKLYDMGGSETVLAEGNCQRVGLEHSEIKYVGGDGEKRVYTMDLADHKAALDAVIGLMTTGETKVLDSMDEIGAAGHRVSMGGAKYVRSVLVSEETIAAFEEMRDVTPLHTPPQVAGIRACQEVFGKDFPMVAGFDTAFHQTLPQVAYMFALPYEYYDKYSLRRFCFHGLSHQYVTERYGELCGRPLSETKIVTCHLGGGNSVGAEDGGKSVDNSFGFGSGMGPLCGTRAGTFDHSAMTYLMKKTGLDFAGLEDVLNRQSGLLGVSGVSSDEKELEDLAAQGHERAQLALDMLVHQVRQYIGSYAFGMGRLDAIVFTGGIGENSDYIRSRICAGLEHYGIRLDEQANVERNRTEAKVSAPDSQVEVWIIPTNEELVIARDTLGIVSALSK